MKRRAPAARPSDAPPADGATVTVTHVAPARGAHATVPRFRLAVTKGPDQGATFVSAGERVVIGTHESADLVLTDPAVSRLHCELVLEPIERSEMDERSLQGSARGQSPLAVGSESRSKPAARGVAPDRVGIRDLQSKNGTLVNQVSVVEAHLHHGALLTLGRTELKFELRAEEIRLAVSSRESFGAMVGKSRAMRRVFELLERASATDATVLLEGETGTGKEAAAESIHQESARRDKPFVVVDCGAIPPDLLESELFGHERGSFTGATGPRDGAFEVASGGTIFLDEIGELSLDLQPKLLRVLERREVKRVGGNKYAAVDVRVVAATNRGLKAAVNEKRFRSDLYYRLAVVQVPLPPLRDRPEDMPALVRHLLRLLHAENDAAASDLLSDAFVANLVQHSWPGNVRELRNYLERCLALRELAPLVPENADGTPAVDFGLPLKVARERWNRRFERMYVEEMLNRNSNNASAAARAAGVDRMHFYRLLWRHGLR